MTDEVREARAAFEDHDAYHRADDGEDGDGEYVLETTAFDGRVTTEPADVDWATRYVLVVRAPTLQSAVEETVGPNLLEGWFETYELRLEDAPGAVRDSVDLEELDVRAEDGDAVAEFVFESGNVDRAPEVAKALAEYAEGTYVEGVVPGYTYRDPVAGLLGRAKQSGGGDGEGEGEGTADGSGPMPL